MELSMLFIALLVVLLALYLLWFLLLADTDLTLAIAEKFGRPISVYRQKVIWITGASSGLGEAMAYELASIGAKLILTARRTTALEQVKQKCLEMAHGKLDTSDVLVLPFDITDPVDVHKAKVKEVLKHFGQIDILINNAALAQLGRTEDTDREVHKHLFEVNFFGATTLTKLVLKHFLERGKGNIIVISSLASKLVLPGLTLYSATKYALNAYFESLRMEHYKDNIHITLVCLGFFKSQLTDRIMRAKINEIIPIGDPIDSSMEMKTSRCAYLTLVSAANELHEVWVAYQPVLLTTYLVQYMPDICRFFASMLVRKKHVDELCEGRSPSGVPTWKPLFR